MSKNVGDEVSADQNNNKIIAAYADEDQAKEIEQGQQKIMNSLKADPRDYNRTLEYVKPIYKIIQDPAFYFQEKLYKSVNSISTKVRDDAAKHKDAKYSEEVLFLTNKLTIVAQLRLRDFKDTKKSIEKLTATANKWDDPDKICQVGETLVEILPILESSYFEPKHNKSVEELKDCIGNKQKMLVEKMIEHIQFQKDVMHWQETIALAIKWLNSTQDNNATIFKLIAEAYYQQTEGLDLQNLNPTGQEDNFALLKNSAEYCLKAYPGPEVKEKVKENCQLAVKIMNKLGELNTPEATKISLELSEKGNKWAAESHDSVYKQFFESLENINKASTTQLPSAATSMYPNLLTETAYTLDTANNNFSPSTATSPIPAVRKNVAYPGLSSSSPEQINKSLPTSGSQDNFNANPPSPQLQNSARPHLRKVVNTYKMEHNNSLNPAEQEQQYPHTLAQVGKALKELELAPPQLRAVFHKLLSSNKDGNDRDTIDTLIAQYTSINNLFAEGDSTSLLGAPSEI